MMQERTTLPVRKATRDKLKTFGGKGESYDGILRRLMEIAEESAFYERQLWILKESRFHPLHEVCGPSLRRGIVVPARSRGPSARPGLSPHRRTRGGSVPPASKSRHKNCGRHHGATFYRLRVGDFRVVYVVEERPVKVTEIFRRGRGYRWLE